MTAKTAAKGEAKFTPEKFEPRHLTSDFLHCDEHKIVTPEGELVADVRGKTPDIACQRTKFLALSPEMYQALQDILGCGSIQEAERIAFAVLDKLKPEAIHG